MAGRPASSANVSIEIPPAGAALAIRRLTDAFRLPVALDARIRNRLGILGYSFLLLVVLPAVGTFIYLAAIASDEFVSEARFAVRGSEESRTAAMADTITMISNFSGVRSTTQDAFIVADYIRSRTIIDDLGGKKIVHELYSQSSVDWPARLASDATFEEVWDYWRGKVTAIIDTQSSIVTLKVRAFGAADAKLLADKVVKRSEALVNEISERSRRDAFARAEVEVQLALQRLARIRAELLEFRNKSSTIDPLTSATSLSETLTLLVRDKLALENNRASLRGMMNDDAPTVRLLSVQIESIDRQIKALQERLTSQAQGLATLAGQLADYEDLQLQNQFAEKLFEISQASLEKARVEQTKQQLYLVTVVQPTLPEEATYPRPFIGTAMIFGLLLVIWSMVSLIIASIRDHIG